MPQIKFVSNLQVRTLLLGFVCITGWLYTKLKQYVALWEIIAKNMKDGSPVQGQ